MNIQNNATHNNPKMLNCINPATLAKLDSIPIPTAEKIQSQITKARQAQQSWAQSDFATREQVLQHMLVYLLDHMDSLCEAIVKDSGNTYEHTLSHEILLTCNKINLFKKQAKKWLQSKSVKTGLLWHRQSQIHHEPLGVIACILHWNSPLQQIIGSLIAPLMAGNAVIIKPAEEVAFSSQAIKPLINQALVKAGVSIDLVQVINGDTTTAAEIIATEVDKILFVGSIEHGKKVMAAASNSLTPVVLSLEGKDPLIICEDANIKKALHYSLAGGFSQLGQNSASVKRIIINKKIHDTFVKQLLLEAQNIRQRIPDKSGMTDVGAMTSKAQINKVDTLVIEAIELGATCLLGGKIEEDQQGQFYPPTILTDLNDKMAIVHEAILGPVMLIFKADNDNDAINRANQSHFGSQASVISENREKSIKTAKAIHAGAISINGYDLSSLNQHLPFAATKSSGFGAMNGKALIREYTTPKIIVFEPKFFNLKFRLFPVKPLDYLITQSAIQFTFSKQLTQKIKALAAFLVLKIKQRFHT